jgi:hypothetical protein
MKYSIKIKLFLHQTWTDQGSEMKTTKNSSLTAEVKIDSIGRMDALDSFRTKGE